MADLPTMQPTLFLTHFDGLLLIMQRANMCPANGLPS